MLMLRVKGFVLEIGNWKLEIGNRNSQSVKRKAAGAFKSYPARLMAEHLGTWLGYPRFSFIHNFA